jgi:hypothetical protein
MSILSDRPKSYGSNLDSTGNQESTVVSTFSGANLLMDEQSVSPPQALACQNVEFIDGQVRIPRRGFAVAWTPAKGITSMWNWLQEQFNRLIVLDRTDGLVYSQDLVTPALSGNVISSGLSTVAGMVCAAVGYRLWMAFFNSSGVGAIQGQVWDGTYNGTTPNVEPLFPRALLSSEVTFSFNEFTTGIMTAGLHNFAVVVTAWNGAVTPPGPWGGGGVLVPQQFTCSGNKNLVITLTPTPDWPMWVNQVQIAMTPVVNPNRWFLVPGAITQVARGGSLTTNITINIDDNSLLSEATEITSTLFDLYTQAADNTGPFNPHCIRAYGARMVYLTRITGPDGLSLQGAIFVSEISQPQYLTLANNLLQLPEFQDTVTMEVFGNNLFVFGPEWTYVFNDNTREPTAWAQCTSISENIGSPFIKGVYPMSLQQGLWVAAKSGLYAFNGSAYSQLPASYLQTPDWNRINWSAPADTLQVIDYPDQRQVWVMAPLDGATVANYIMIWDYTKSYAPAMDDTGIRYCGTNWINTPGGSPTKIPLGALALVHSPTVQFLEAWVAAQSSSPGIIYRQKYAPADASLSNPTALYDDNGAGIDGKYRLASMTDYDQYYQQIGITVRAKGNGNLLPTYYGMDQTNGTALATIPLSMTPAVQYDRILDAQSYAACYEFSNQATVGWFAWISRVKGWFSRWIIQGDA